MSMTVDCRAVVSVETADAIERADMAVNDARVMERGAGTVRNAERRYYRLLRRVSGNPGVTCRMKEHTGEVNPATRTIAFGRWCA